MCYIVGNIMETTNYRNTYIMRLLPNRQIVTFHHAVSQDQLDCYTRVLHPKVYDNCPTSSTTPTATVSPPPTPVPQRRLPHCPTFIVLLDTHPCVQLDLRHRHCTSGQNLWLQHHAPILRLLLVLFVTTRC